MSTETGAEKGRLSKSSTETEGTTDIETNEGVSSSEESKTATPQNADDNQTSTRESENTAVTPASISSDLIPGDGSRQIIAVSANKNPTAFFQLARKFLMTNETCDLSALEGAIVSAVDAAHLLERSQLASIVRIHTSYVNVEPKRRRQSLQQQDEVNFESIREGVTSTSISEDAPNATQQSQTSSTLVSTSTVAESKKSTNASESQQEDGKQPTTNPSTARSSAKPSSGNGNRELRRARILVTVKRTESYRRWLEENPSQRHAIIAGTASEDVVGGGSSSKKKDSAGLRKSPPPSSSE